jgi:hypothetical protein
METGHEVIYDSPPSEPDDDFWLDQGKKMVEGSLPALREAAKSFLTGLGVLQGIYLGILGFSEFIPKTMPLLQKSLFLIPLLCWLEALRHSLQVMMTQRLNIYFHSPDDIRKKSDSVLVEKQGKLQWAFWFLTLGLVAAFVLLVYRLSL